MLRTLIPAVLALLTCSIAAQTNQPTASGTSGGFKTDSLWGSAATNRLRLGAFVDYTYVAPADVDYSGTKGRSGSESITVGVSGEIPLNAHWYVPLGINSENVWLRSVIGVPVPDQINVLRFNTGVGVRFEEKWTVTASVGPMLYTLDDIKSDDWGIMGTAGVVYRAKPNLTLIGGFVVNPDSEIPVFPGLGARWDIRTNLTLNLIFPRPGVIYRPMPKLSLFVGGGVSGATFRTDDAMGSKSGLPRFNRALATYWDFRLGVGAEYEIIKRLSVSLEGGYSLGRRIHYTDLDETVKFDPSPYFQAGLRYRF